MSQIFRVALDTPLRRLFDYVAPLQETLLPAIGARVRVPFGRQRRVGVITQHADTSEVPPGKLKPILEVLDAAPVLDAALQGLLLWAAEYYHHPIGEVLASALPRALISCSACRTRRTRPRSDSPTSPGCRSSSR